MKKVILSFLLVGMSLGLKAQEIINGSLAVKGGSISVESSGDGSRAYKFGNNYGQFYYDAISTGESNRGIYFQEKLSNQRGFHFLNATGTELLKIKGNGNVGIGTTSPKATLQIAQPNTVSRTSVKDLLYLSTSISSVGHDGFGTGIVDYRRTYQNGTPHAINRISFIERGNSSANNGGAITFSTKRLSSGTVAPLERMRIDYNGNIGIGVKKPLVALQIVQPNGGSRTSVKDLIYLGTSISSVGYDGFGTGIVDYRRTYQNETPHAINRISFIERGNSSADRGGAITFATKTLSSGSVAPVERMRVDYNGNVGIGVSNPIEKFQIGSSYSFHDGGHKVIGFLHMPSVGDLDATRFSSEIRFDPTSGNLRLGTSKSITTSPETHLTIDNKGNIGIGTTTPDSKLAVNGKIHTKEVKVDLIGWSDFVFESSYNLPTLKEVEAHILEKGHLKDIPSAKEVAKNGIELGAMNAKLLQKIEELTLYTIQQEKKMKLLLNRIEKLENK